MEWSEDHLKAIKKIENSVLKGDVFALAMPRGSGKTTLILAALIWAVVNGYKRYIVLIASDKEAAVKLLDSIKSELEYNQTLYELYPEACHAFRALEGKPNKATGQILNGKRTNVEWKSTSVVFAGVPGAKCSNAIIETFGILGRIRGAQFTRPDTLEPVRPDLFMLDDPQTDTSADSAPQIRRRLKVIQGTVLGLAGPGKSIAGFAAVTVIQPADVADQLLDKDKYPEWHGQRYKLIYKWPDKKAQDYWDKYATLRAECLKEHGHSKTSDEFYKDHWKAMNKGAKVAWPARFDPTKGEIDSLQHVYNLKLKSPETFDAEFQNDPQPPEADVEQISVKDLESKLHGFKRNELPTASDTVTAFVDVQGQLLYYMVVAWESSSFTGYVMDYGAWPEQTASHFTLRNARKTLAGKYPRRGLEGRLRAGLMDLLDELTARKYQTRDGNLSNKIRLCGIDAAWGPSTKTVQAVVLEHQHSTRLLATYGRGLKPTDNPMAEWRAKPGEKKGPFWIVRPTLGGGHHCVVDTNAAKSFTNSRLNVAIGDGGSLSLFTPKLATEHRMAVEHIRAENVQTITVSGGRSGEVWTLPPAKPDNHLWDCLVGNAVMGSLCGVQLPDMQAKSRTKRRTKRRRTKLVA